MPESFSSILITGASSGIGAALAGHYAGPSIRLVLHGRDSDRLDAVALACRTKGAEVETARFDVIDREACADAVRNADAIRPLDLVIANAGIGGGNAETSDAVLKVMEVNFGGVLNTLLPALDAMAPRRRGTVALVSSLASFRGLPGGAAYGASKAAVRLLGEGLRAPYLQRGLKISVVLPGFVISPMTARNTNAMPLLMPAERAAAIIASGLAQGKARIAFPRRMLALTYLLMMLPPDFVDRYMLGIRR
ncbi:MAG TPA: SDR family NAD(P)-dependent oxidoreductase [Aliidongia sp.]|nr:SDR family NAD(P)-dependent oxidoreductase [Aliidongia sp.]